MLLDNTEFLSQLIRVLQLPSVNNNNGCTAGHSLQLVKYKAVIKFFNVEKVSGVEIHR